MVTTKAGELALIEENNSFWGRFGEGKEDEVEVEGGEIKEVAGGRLDYDSIFTDDKAMKKNVSLSEAVEGKTTTTSKKKKTTRVTIQSEAAAAVAAAAVAAEEESPIVLGFKDSLGDGAAAEFSMEADY